jgi:hypothetical protein
MSNELERMQDKAVEEAAKVAKDFLGKLLDPALQESGGILGDTLAYWRFKNKVNLALKAKRFLEEKGISPRGVTPKVLLPILEHGSLESSEDLKAKWSAMLANAATPGASEVPPSYAEILRELSSFEVRLLDKLYDETLRQEKQKRLEVSFLKEKICAHYQVSPEDFDVILDNLMRLNLVTKPATFGGMGVGGENGKTYPFSIETRDFFHMSALGIRFVSMCRLN